MTSALIPVLAPRETVTWAMAKVFAITGNTLTLDWQGTQVPYVPRLASYVPSVGDNVHLLIYGPTGILVLGTSPEDAPVTPPAPPAALLFEPVESATYDYEHGTWNTALIQASLGTAGVLHYSLAGQSMSTVAKVSVRLTASADSATSVGMRLITNSDLSGSLSLLGAPEIVGLTPNEEQWIDLPLYWASRLATGTATGIALVAPANTPSSVTVTGGTLKINQL